MMLLLARNPLCWDTSALAVGVGYVQAGAPDILGIGPKGRLVACELKAKGGKLTAPQRKRGEQIKAAGGRYRVCFTLREVLDAFGHA